MVVCLAGSLLCVAGLGGVGAVSRIAEPSCCLLANVALASECIATLVVGCSEIWGGLPGLLWQFGQSLNSPIFTDCVFTVSLHDLSWRSWRAAVTRSSGVSGGVVLLTAVVWNYTLALAGTSSNSFSSSSSVSFARPFLSVPLRFLSPFPSVSRASRSHWVF